MENIHFNKDFYLSAYLIADGNELLDYSRTEGYTTFMFRENEKLSEAIRKFHSLTAIVEPNKYGNAIKSLKTLIHSEKISTSKSNSENETNKKGHNSIINKR